MSGWGPTRPPWETQEQPVISPGDDSSYGRTYGPRVIIRSHESPVRGTWRPDRQMPRGVALASVVAGLVAVVAITWGVLRLTHVIGSGPAAAPTTSVPAFSPNVTSSPAASIATPTAGPTTSAGGTGAGTAYVLSTPATAGGYTFTTPMSASIKEIGTAGATALMQAVEAGGGTSTANVSGQYLITGDQALGYAGFTGTFSPKAVMTAFGQLATGVTSEPAGTHGGLLSCGTVTASSTGTACVWATTTTVGMVEFFGGHALEKVTLSRAGQDTAKFRADVETLKGVGSTGTN